MNRKKIVSTGADLIRAFTGAPFKEMMAAANFEVGDSKKLPRFEADVREAALFFVAEAGKATLNEVHYEIDELVRAALWALKARKRPDAAFEKVARRVEQLSVQARKILNKRGTLPDAAMLRDPARQREACETVLRLGRLGACYKEGRKRPGGKRSTVEIPVLHAPKLEQWPLRREPHHAFLTWLEEAHLAAKGKWPPRTANPSSPWILFVQAYFDQLDPGVSGVELINEHHRRRRMKQLSHVVQRWEKVLGVMFLRLARRSIIDAIKRLSGQNP